MPESQETPQSDESESREIHPLRSVSQNDFRHTPFEATAWERVGEEAEDREFTPMAVSVLKMSQLFEDDMFEVFDPDRDRSGLPRHHGSESPIEKEEDRLAKEAELERQKELEIEQRIAEAKQGGYESGYLEAKTEIMEHYAGLEERVAAFTNQLQEQANGLFATIEQEALRMSVNIAKKIIETTVEAKPDYIIEVIREGLRSLGAAQPLRIRVSPQDMEFLEIVGLPPELSTEELGVQYVLDESIKSGCLIETDFGEVDLQLERMWEQIQANLFEVSS